MSLEIQLTGKIAVVTGGGTGIGKAIAGRLAISTTVHGLVMIVRARRRHGGSDRRALLKCGWRSLRRGLFSPLLGRRRLLPMGGFHRQCWSEGDVGMLHDRPDLDLLGHRKRRGWRLRDGLPALDAVARGGIGATRCGAAALRASPGRVRRTTPPARPPASAAAAAR